MSVEYCVVKTYLDKAVQTDFQWQLRPEEEPAEQDPSRDTSLVSPDLNESNSSVIESTHLSSMDSPHLSREDSEDTQDLSLAVTSRAYNKDLSHRTLKVPSARIVSLPETASLFSAKRALAKTSTRVVSNPERPSTQRHDLSQSSDSLDISTETDPFLCDSQVLPRARVRAAAMDAPYTPSPPSSPDSIVIIADKSQLPRGFLRNKATLESSTPDVKANGEGWIMWTRSPPRPIPALHGPLSLPYARCPSGAEGTVIEEPENLPRIIWGLEGEDSNRPSTDSVLPLPTQSTPQKPVRVTQPLVNQQVPPRFLNPPEANKPTGEPLLKSSAQPPGGQRARASSPSQNILSEHPDLQRSLPGHGPIDLSDILRPRRFAPAYSASARELYDPIQQESYPYGLGGISSDWQALLLSQDKLQDRTLPSSGSLLTDEFSDYLRPSFSASSISSLASSRSPIVIEPTGHLSSHQMNHQDLPRRMSALEIAQKYRQDQLHQQSALPTPPNSSSPIWTSRYSPHQSSFVSPDLLQRNVLPQGSSGFVHTASRALRPRLGPTTLDTLPSNSAAPGLYVPDRETQTGAKDHLSRLQDMSILERTIMNPTHLPQYRGITVSTNSNLVQAPAHKLPTPSVTTQPLVAQDFPRRASSLTTPGSPTSSILGIKGTASLQSRPAFASQRRLSAVPEEDLATLHDLGRTPSPAISPAAYRSDKSSAGKPSASGAIEDSRKPQADLGMSTLCLHQVEHVGHPAQGAAEMNTLGNQLLSAQSSQTQPLVRIPHGRGKGPVAVPLKGKGDPRQHEEPSRAGRGRGRGRGGGKPRRGRGAPPGRGPERVDGGMTVRS